MLVIGCSHKSSGRGCWSRKLLRVGVLTTRGLKTEPGGAGLGCLERRAGLGDFLRLFPAGNSSSSGFSRTERLFGSSSPWAL